MKGLTKEEIILKAIKVWNETSFQNISLSPVAKALGISKPALYKHFHDKDELLTDIYDYFVSEQAKFWRDFFNKQKGFSGNILRLLVRFLASFFLERQEFVIFRKYMLINMKLTNQIDKIQIKSVLNKGELDELISKFEYNGYFIENENSFFTYLFTVVEVWIALQCDLFKAFSFDTTKYPTQTLLDTCVDEVTTIMENGFFTNAENGNIDFSDIETKIENNVRNKTFPNDVVFNAIADIIMEEGFWSVSVNKIATKLGIAKSSLYNYFENKKEMINDSFFKMQNGLKEYLEENIFSQTNKYAVWYSMLYFSYWAMGREIRNIIFMNSFFNKINENNPVFKMIAESYKEKVPQTHKLFGGVFSFPFLVNQVLIVRYVFFTLIKGDIPESKVIRNLYKLSVYGIKKGER